MKPPGATKRWGNHEKHGKFIEFSSIADTDRDDDTYRKSGYERRKEWYRRIRNERTSGSPVPTASGNQTYFLQTEVEHDFINAQFLSALIVAAAVIEQILYSQVAFIDNSTRSSNYTLGRTIEKALDLDIIFTGVTDSFDDVHKISNLRNGVVHYRGVFDEREDPIFDSFFDDFDEYHPNKHGKKFSKKMIIGMFDIVDKCNENQSLQYEGKGPLTQGIETHRHGEEFYCPKPSK